MAHDLPDTAHIANLKPDEANARKHNPANLGMIEKSIQTNGFGRAVLVAKDGTIIAGNATIDAAASAGLENMIVVDSDGTKVIAVRRTDIEPGSPQFIELALADNRAAELAEWDAEALAALDDRDDIDLEDFFPDAMLDSMFEGMESDEDRAAAESVTEPDEAETAEDAGSHAEKGELLKLVDVTIEEPRHVVEKGDRWVLGGTHLLFVGSVMEDHAMWAPELVEGSFFCPYPGAFTPMSRHAEKHRLVMVQPNTYIAGHILDRYTDVNGDESVVKDNR